MSCPRVSLGASGRLHQEQEKKGRSWSSPEEMPHLWPSAVCAEQNKSQQAKASEMKSWGDRKQVPGDKYQEIITANTLSYLPCDPQGLDLLPNKWPRFEILGVVSPWP